MWSQSNRGSPMIRRRTLWNMIFNRPLASSSSPQHNHFHHETPLQISMRMARRRRVCTSPRQLLMLLSVLTLLAIVVIYCWDARSSSFVFQTYKENEGGDENSVSGSFLSGITRSHSRAKQIAALSTTSDESSDSRKQAQSAAVVDNDENDPNIYGWTPDMYPHPILDPVRCAISHVLDPISFLDPYNTNLSSHFDSQQQQQQQQQQYSPHQQQQHAPLYLCDPDGVLGSKQREELSWRLLNFTSQVHDSPFLLPTPPLYPSASNNKNNNNNNQNNNNVYLGVATVHKMNLQAVLRSGSYFAYEDETDMVNDAAQVFARTLYDQWFVQERTRNSKNINNNHDNDGNDDDDDDYNDNNQGNTINEHVSSTSSYILIFLSIQDGVCFISTGLHLSHVLPWWRLDQVVANMKPDLRVGNYEGALVSASVQLTNLLLGGPPTMSDRFHDFVARFGVVIAFAMFTFLFGAWGEYRDRKKRWLYAEQRSRLSGVERDKARQLQQDYHTRVCPICLETFDYGDACVEFDDEQNDYIAAVSKRDLCNKQDEEFQKPCVLESPSKTLRRVDTFGIPLQGCDGKKIKLLRCGHLFCETCWNQWVHSGYGNPCVCPICRQDVGRAPRKRASSQDPDLPTQTQTTAGLVIHDQDTHSENQQQSLYGTTQDSNHGLTASSSTSLLDTLRSYSVLSLSSAASGSSSSSIAVDEATPLTSGSITDPSSNQSPLATCPLDGA